MRNMQPSSATLLGIAEVRLAWRSKLVRAFKEDSRRPPAPRPSRQRPTGGTAWQGPTDALDRPNTSPPPPKAAFRARAPRPPSNSSAPLASSVSPPQWSNRKPYDPFHSKPAPSRLQAGRRPACRIRFRSVASSPICPLAVQIPSSRKGQAGSPVPSRRRVIRNGQQRCLAA